MYTYMMYLNKFFVKLNYITSVLKITGNEYISFLIGLLILFVSKICIGIIICMLMHMFGYKLNIFP